jgi:TonB family protein
MCALTAVVVFSCVVVGTLAQSATGPSSQDGVFLIKLSRPIYPRLALIAHISGDVEVAVGVRRDGSVESASVISGPQLLRQAALESAQQSQFDCRNCRDAVTTYQLVYTFQLGPTIYCDDAAGSSSSEPSEQGYPRVIQSQDHVTLVDRPIGTCDPVEVMVRTKVHSVKCLYLWKCGVR